MSTSMARYVFFNNAADRESVRNAGTIATACGARVVELLPKAVLMDVDVDSLPDIAALLVGWQSTPDRRQLRGRGQASVGRATAPSRPAALAA
ncbi:hypothetical protein ACS5PN_22860 [Roseateles sp. NT4]|uniref:hypothetical protein n=1 Tax=Roseateles sp. NT4 TaxID=3453715 RepID=UPI003EE94B78